MSQQNARFAQVTSAHVATLSAKMNEARKDGMWSSLAISLALGMAIPMFGVALGYVVHRHQSAHVEDKQKDVLAEHYKDQVAATLGIDPNKVTGKQLEMASRINPTIAGAIEKVKQEHKNSNRAALFGMAGAFATGSAFVPGAGGVVSEGITKLAIDGTGLVAGDAISSLFNKAKLHVHDVMEIIDTKQKKGQPVSPQDVMLLRIAQSEPLQKMIKKHSDIAFHKMNESQQQAVIASLPSGYWAEAQESAAKVNSGQMTAQNLLMASTVSNDNDNAANDNNGTSWRAREEQRRATSAAQGPQLG